MAEFSERYDLTEKLGEGGMGEVWAGYDKHLDRRVAIKLLFTPVGGSARHKAQERFRREARTTARLEHPGVPTVYDVGMLDDGRMYVVMQRVPGRTLADLLKDWSVFPVRWAAAVAAQISEVLSYAHELGVVHRDIKPANLMLTPAGAVKVLDFGIAAALEPDPGEPALTRTGAVIGTQGYMAPERIRGQRATPRSDLYEFGCVLYRLLAGVPPFVAESPGELPYLHVNAELPHLGERREGIPKEFAELVERLLAKAPEQRPGSAAEIFTVAAALVTGGEAGAAISRAGAVADLTTVTAPGLGADQEYDPTLYYTRRLGVPKAAQSAAARRSSPVPPSARATRPAHAAAAPPAALPRQASTPPPPLGRAPRHEAKYFATAGRYSQAADLLAAFIDEADRPLNDPELIGDRLDLYGYYRQGGELQRAYDGYFLLGAALRPTRSATDRDVLACRAGTARCLRELGRTAEALIEYEGLLPYQERALGPTAREVFDTRFQIAVLHAGAGDVHQARMGLLRLRDDLPTGHPVLDQAEALIARLERLAGRNS